MARRCSVCAQAWGTSDMSPRVAGKSRRCHLPRRSGQVTGAVFQMSQMAPHSVSGWSASDASLFSVKGNQILSGLSVEEYKAALKVIKQAILATDLALYIK